MKYRIELTLFKLVPGQVNKKFQLVLNEMGLGQISPHGISTALRYCAPNQCRMRLSLWT